LGLRLRLSPQDKGSMGLTCYACLKPAPSLIAHALGSIKIPCCQTTMQSFSQSLDLLLCPIQQHHRYILIPKARSQLPVHEVFTLVHTAPQVVGPEGNVEEEQPVSRASFLNLSFESF
jgi:hypothetical protein